MSWPEGSTRIQTKIFKPLPEGVTFRDGSFHRNCPRCGVHIEYSRRDMAIRSDRRNACCKSCGQTKRAGVIHAGVERGIRRAVFEKYRTDAEARGYEFNITIDDVADVLEAQAYKCAYTGQPVSLEKSKKNSGSIDRIDNSIGYIPSNIQVTTAKINIMRGSLTNDEFIMLCKAVAAISNG